MVLVGICIMTGCSNSPQEPQQQELPENKVVDLGEGIELVMVWVPGGEFIMGSPETEKEREPDEGPRTRVVLSNGFWMGKYELTQAQWQQVMGDNPAYFQEVGPDAPVEQVSWHDCTNFIAKLNQLVPGARFRLPTEAEWEYACRANTTTRYNLGDADLDLNGAAWYSQNSEETTHVVGTKAPNAFGLHDMHGNVWEWCADLFASNLPGGSVTDPTGPEAGNERVNRGGAWFNGAWLCRSAIRSGMNPDHRGFDLGVRLASD